MIGCLLFVAAVVRETVLEERIFDRLSRKLNPTEVQSVADQGSCPTLLAGSIACGPMNLSRMFCELVRQTDLERFRVAVIAGNCPGVCHF